MILSRLLVLKYFKLYGFAKISKTTFLFIAILLTKSIEFCVTPNNFEGFSLVFVISIIIKLYFLVFSNNASKSETTASLWITNKSVLVYFFIVCENLFALSPPILICAINKVSSFNNGIL